KPVASDSSARTAPTKNPADPDRPPAGTRPRLDTPALAGVIAVVHGACLPASRNVLGSFAESSASCSSVRYRIRRGDSIGSAPGGGLPSGLAINPGGRTMPAEGLVQAPLVT